MDFIEITIPSSSVEQREILISLLAEENFESFVETDNELLAYVSVTNYARSAVAEVCHQFGLNFSEKQIAGKNWNTEWEKNFEPVTIAELCHIRATFHTPRPEFRYEIIIEPKMSFGTAHHETTAMMIQIMLGMDFNSRKVLDMGCGTGILAILGHKMGAKSVDALDIDEWAITNALENIGKNNAGTVRVINGDINAAGTGYNIILANINRNVLLSHIPEYARVLDKGQLLLSGFYEEDFVAIREAAESNGFSLECSMSKNKWVAARFSK